MLPRWCFPLPLPLPLACGGHRHHDAERGGRAPVGGHHQRRERRRGLLRHDEPGVAPADGVIDKGPQLAGLQRHRRQPDHRWSSAFSDPQWLEVDLGSTRPICQVAIHRDRLRQGLPDPDPRVTAQSTWKSPWRASWLPGLQEIPPRHIAAPLRQGRIFRALSTRRMVDALTPWPSASSSASLPSGHPETHFRAPHGDNVRVLRRGRLGGLSCEYSQIIG
jgi:hypothetical protein